MQCASRLACREVRKLFAPKQTPPRLADATGDATRAAASAQPWFAALPPRPLCRRKACTKGSRSPSSTPAALPVSTPVRRSLTILYGCST